MRTSGAELTTPLAVGCGRAKGTLTGVARKRRIFGSEASTSYSLYFYQMGPVERSGKSDPLSFCAIGKPIEFGHQCFVRLWPKVSNYTFLNAIPAFSCLRQYLHALLGDLRGS